MKVRLPKLPKKNGENTYGGVGGREDDGVEQEMGDVGKEDNDDDAEEDEDS